VTNTLRLLNLPGGVQKALVDGEITEGHARALLGLTNPRAIESALRTVLFQKMTVRQTEELVNKLKGEKPAAVTREGPSPEEKSLEDYLRTSLGQKLSVKIGKDRSSGSMTLYYGSEEEFQDLMIRLTGQKYTP
jgi:ParB family chromosome partitioning protein